MFAIALHWRSRDRWRSRSDEKRDNVDGRTRKARGCLCAYSTWLTGAPTRSLRSDQSDPLLTPWRAHSHGLDIGTAAGPPMTEVGRRGSLQAAAVEARQVNTDGLAVADKFWPSRHGSFPFTVYRDLASDQTILEFKTCYTMR